LLKGDLRSLPFEEGSIDCLTCQGVLHHLEDVPAALAEFARVLRPGGVFYLAEPCTGSNLALRVWRRVRAEWLRRRPEETGPPPANPEALDHDEAPIDLDELKRGLASAELDGRFEYWCRFDGLERLPGPLYALALRVLTRPWRTRSGDLVFVTGSKRPT
jgi:SAM-dependent methyltransferase